MSPDLSEPSPSSPAPIPLPRTRPRPRSWRWAIAAALFLALVGASWIAMTTLGQRLAAVRAQNAALRHQLDDERVWLALLESPRSVVVDLHATSEGSPELAARVIFDPSTRRALVLCDRFAAPIGKDYQLWAMVAGSPTSLGLVRPDAAGHAVIRLADVGDPRPLEGFSVTLEREGGSPTSTAPAGPVVMQGKLGG